MVNVVAKKEKIEAKLNNICSLRTNLFKNVQKIPDLSSNCIFHFIILQNRELFLQRDNEK